MFNLSQILKPFLPKQPEVSSGVKIGTRMGPPMPDVRDMAASAVKRGEYKTPMEYFQHERPDAIAPSQRLPTQQSSSQVIPTTQPVQQPIQQPVASPAVTQMYGRNPAIAQHLAKNPLTPEVKDAIEGAAKRFNLDPNILYDVAFQESRYNPKTVNPENNDASGLFQFMKDSWKTVGNYARNSSTFTDFNPDPQARFDPRMNALSAAYMISHGQLGRWNASQNVWGPHYTQEEVQPYYSQTLEENKPKRNWKK